MKKLRGSAFLLVCMSSILCLSIGVFVGYRISKGASTRTDGEPTAISGPESVPLDLQAIGLESVSSMFPKGITGCWRLSDGTLLLEGPEMYGNLYARFYPQYDKACYVAGSEWICTVKDIADNTVTFVGRGNGNCAMCFPYIWKYDMKTQTWSEQEKAYIPVTQGVELGLNLPNASQGALLSDVHLHDNLVEINWRDTSAGSSPYFSIHSDPETKRLVIEIPDTAADTEWSLPLNINNNQGIVRSVHVAKGTSKNSDFGVTVSISLSSSEWDRLTYAPSVNPNGSAETMRVLGTAFYDDRDPTDLTIRVKR